MPLLLEHIERNVSNINDLINHFDELYLASLSERGSKQSFWISAGLAGVSLAFILYTLPSFWADLQVIMGGTASENPLFNTIELVGNILALPILISALGIILWSLRAALRMRRMRKGSQEK